ncbi:MAG: hypothetical protein DHS20C17_25010 [Cyclobacteriaceae bacterium]|nr:MAG: hypothetical protein DHS20C17_25010 [Cyclobacteriaceae bacterium]
MKSDTTSFKILPVLALGLVLLQVGCNSTTQSSSPDPVLEVSNSVENITLRDFDPVSLYKVPHTKVTKARFPVIDLHAHPYANSKEELEQWIKTMDQVGIEKSVILTYTTGAKFDSLYRVYSAYGDRFILFCGFDYTGYDQPGFGPAAVKELERCFKVGARGVGELGDKGKGLFYSQPTKGFGMHIDDPRMQPLIKKCGELGIPISIHVAEPIWMYAPMNAHNDGLMNAFYWRLDNQPDIVDHEGMIRILENAVGANPETTFIACHYANCSYDLQILARMFDKYPNLMADIAGRFGEVAPIPRFVKKFFETYQDRLVYGTDMGMDKEMYHETFRILESEDEHFYNKRFEYHWPLNGIGLSSQTLDKIYNTNARVILEKAK